jgi:hypothetical protein
LAELEAERTNVKSKKSKKKQIVLWSRKLANLELSEYWHSPWQNVMLNYVLPLAGHIRGKRAFFGQGEARAVGETDAHTYNRFQVQFLLEQAVRGEVGAEQLCVVVA